MNVKTMTARDAKTHFGEFLDTMQREPVMITKNNRPVGIMLSIEDAADTLVADLFLTPEAGYDEWLRDKVTRTQKALTDSFMTRSPMNEVRDRLRERLARRRVTSSIA